MNINNVLSDRRKIGWLLLTLTLLFIAAGAKSAKAETINCQTQTFISIDECKGLKRFYKNTNGATWKNKDKWMTNTNPCTWNGVTCSGGLVTSLILTDNGLTGYLKPSINKLVNLRTLNLANNKIEGIIPSELEDISGLKVLYLNNNLLSGNLPKDIVNIVKLEIFNVEFNTDLVWAIPPHYGNLKNMQFFMYKGTKLCAPNEPFYQLWEGAIGHTSKTGYRCDPLILDSFENGNFDGWEDTINQSLGLTGLGFSVVDEIENRLAGCNLCVKKSAALVDQYGLKVNIPNRQARFIQLSRLDNLHRLNVRFYIDPSNLSIDSSSKFQVFQTRFGTTIPFSIFIGRDAGGYKVRAISITNDGFKKSTKWAYLPAAPSTIEVDWMASNNLITPNGFIKLYVNGGLRTGRYNINNGKHIITALRWGITKQITVPNSVSGSFLLDHFGADLSTYIGP
ncbi:MAG: hypothetical protein OEZ02_10370 [Anaerolineae bacterium]|nr:hypothetical protein [Anaerolineae bacterium]